MPKQKRFNSKVPPCPDPERYTLVKGQLAYYWRRNRGTVKPAKLNEVLRKSAAITATSNRASKQVMNLLGVYTQHMALGSTATRIAGAFKKSYLKKGKMDFSEMSGIEFQPGHRQYKLYSGMVQKEAQNGLLQLRVPYGSLHLSRQNRHNESYRFTAILLYGDPMKDHGIRIETEESPAFYFDQHPKEALWEPGLVLPAKKRPWMVMMFLVCKHDIKVQTGPKYHALWVLAVG